MKKMLIVLVLVVAFVTMQVAVYAQDTTQAKTATEKVVKKAENFRRLAGACRTRQNRSARGVFFP